MSKVDSTRNSANRLFSLSLRRPVLVMLCLFILAYLIKLLDTFVLRLDELLGEAILTKALGFLLVFIYVKACGKNLRDIGFHRRFLTRSLLIAGVSSGTLYVAAYTAQLILLRSSDEDASLAWSAVDPVTGMTGGLSFAIWLLLANLVNSAMEEGLFRGTMIRHFLLRFSGWGAILLAAGLFAVWHLSRPVRDLLDGSVTLAQASFEGTALLLATAIAGIVYGYLYLRTDNLWAPFLGHTINNGIFNVLFIKTSLGLQSGQEFGLFIAILLGGYLLLIPAIGFACTRLGMPIVKPWGDWDEATRQDQLAPAATPYSNARHNME